MDEEYVKKIAIQSALVVAALFGLTTVSTKIDSSTKMPTVQCDELGRITFFESSANHHFSSSDAADLNRSPRKTKKKNFPGMGCSCTGTGCVCRK